MGSRNKTTRLSVDLSSNMTKLVESLAQTASISKTDVVRLAVLLLHEVKKSEEAGGYVAVIDKNGDKTKFILLTNRS